VQSLKEAKIQSLFWKRILY